MFPQNPVLNPLRCAVNITTDVIKLDQTEPRRLQRLETVPMETEAALGYRSGGG